MIRRLLILMAASVAILCSCSSLEKQMAEYVASADMKFEDISVTMDAFAEYAELLAKADSAAAASSLLSLMDRLSTEEIAYYIYNEWIEEVLHAPISPVRSDELFVVWSERVISDGVLDRGLLEKIGREADCCRRLRPGSMVPDFTLVDEFGAEFSLVSFVGEPLVVFAADLSCSSCREALLAYDTSPSGTRYVAVIANASEEMLRSFIKAVPQETAEAWRFGYDPSRRLESGEVFDLSLAPFALSYSSEGRLLSSEYALSGSEE